MALRAIIPGARFPSFAYPISEPRPSVKAAASRHFACCRGAGQKPNVGTVDLHQLSACFLERSRDDIRPVKELVDLNSEQRGWLIFATHDVADAHGPYGCTPTFFRNVTEYAVQSGAQILPVGRAMELMGITPIGAGRNPECALSCRQVNERQPQR
jgi:hypothetical protein